jgi:hypothetical protein
LPPPITTLKRLPPRRVAGDQQAEHAAARRNPVVMLTGRNGLAEIERGGRPATELTAPSGGEACCFVTTKVENHDDTSHECVRHDEADRQCVDRYAVPAPERTQTTCRTSARSNAAATSERHDGLQTTEGGAQSNPRERVKGICYWRTIPLNQRDGGGSQRQCLRFR